MSHHTLNDRVVVKLDKANEKTESGLYIPENAQEGEPGLGTVMAVSEGVITDAGTFRPLDVEVGDRVLVREYGGTEISLNLEGEEAPYFVFREADIFAKVEED
jgi:chaperonin GroES